MSNVTTVLTQIVNYDEGKVIGEVNFYFENNWQDPRIVKELDKAFIGYCKVNKLSTDTHTYQPKDNDRVAELLAKY